MPIVSKAAGMSKRHKQETCCRPMLVVYSEVRSVSVEWCSYIGRVTNSCTIATDI